MRKYSAAISLVAVSALALSLAACSTEPSSNEDGKTVLSWSGWSGDEVADALMAKFKEQNPDVTFKYTGLPWPNILTQINTELVSGTASDIVTVFPGNGNPITVQTLAKGSYLADLSDQSWTANFNDANKTVMGADGKVFMGSNNFTIIPATYNTSALEELGASVPTTWSEVLDLCAAAKDDGKVAYAFAGLAGGNFIQIVYSLTATLVDGPTPDFAAQQAAGDVSFSNSAWSDAFDKQLEMRDAGCFSQDPLGTALEVAQKQVATGEAVGIVTVSNQIGDIETMAPDGTTFETAALPATDDPTQTVLPVGLGAGYGVNAKSKNLELAKKFMEFYLSAEGMKIALDTNPGMFPSQPVEGWEPSPVLAGVADEAQGDKTAAFPDQTWPSSNMGQVFQDETQKLLGDQTSVKDALKSMDNAYVAG